MSKQIDKEMALFYEGIWYAFSNFAAFQVFWRGMWWATSEHAYQAAKFMGVDDGLVAMIQAARSPHDAKQIAKKHMEKIRADWKKVNFGIMEDIIRAKITQHPYIQKMLLRTGEMEIVEDSPRDAFWGRGKDWDGFNHLGRIYMRYRGQLAAGTFKPYQLG